MFCDKRSIANHKVFLCAPKSGDEKSAAFNFLWRVPRKLDCRQLRIDNDDSTLVNLRETKIEDKILLRKSAYFIKIQSGTCIVLT